MRVCFVFDRCSDALYKNKSLISSDQKEYQYELKRIYHSVQDNPLHLIQSGNPQNKAPQALCPYTHSKQRTTGNTALYTLKNKVLQATGGKSLYTLKTNYNRRYDFIRTHNDNDTAQAVCPYAHSKQSTSASTSLQYTKNKATQLVRPWTHSKQSTTRGMFQDTIKTKHHSRFLSIIHSKQNTTCGMSLYTLWTKHHTLYGPIHYKQSTTLGQLS